MRVGMHVCVSVGKHLKVWSRDRDGARYIFRFVCRGTAETVGHKSRPCMKNVDLGIFLKCEWAVQHDKG